jgi:hypothetical protein
MDTPAGYEAKMGDVIIGNMRVSLFTLSTSFFE